MLLNNSHNKREKARNSTLIVEMKGQTTYLQNPEEPNEEPKKFTFDFSYWSHDGFEEKPDGYLAPTVPHYADQVSIAKRVKLIMIMKEIWCMSITQGWIL